MKKTSKNKKAKVSETVFRDNLLFLISQKNMTYLEFASDANIERHRVERWLKAICFPKYTMMVQLCEYFGYYDIYKLLTTDISAVK